MAIAVSVLGFFVVAIGIVFLVVPSRMKGMLGWLTQGKLFVAAISRLLFGVVFLVAAPQTRWPGFVMGLGMIFIIAALVLPVIGTSRIKAIAQWWMDRGDGVIRIWALSAIAFGALIAYAGGFP